MTSPMQRRRMRLEREKSQVNSEPKSNELSISLPMDSSGSTFDWDLIRGTLDSDKRQLKKLKRLSDKIEYKTKVIENYLPYLERNDAPVDIKMLLMVWLFDVGNLTKALELGQEAVNNCYTMPDFIKSAAPEFIADTVLKWSEAQFKVGHSTAPYFDQVFKLVTEKFNTYEVLTARYYKLAGLMALGKHKTIIKYVSEPDDLRKALVMFTKADELYSSIGVGTRIGDIKKRLALLMEDTK